MALSVDGRNVVDAKRTTEREATKWILGPGQTVDIPGWQVSGETARKFFFTETARSYAKWLGDTSNVGTIEAVFFREKPRELPRMLEDAAPAPGAAGKPESRPSADAPTARSRHFGPGARPTVSPRPASATAPTFPVTWVAFEEEPTPAARVALRYEFRPELVRLGVLRPRDGLTTREQARGFEHDYAPDPDGRR